MTESLKYGKWYHVKNHYTPPDAPGGVYLDTNGSCNGCTTITNYADVSASKKKDRVGLGTGVWRIIPASVSNPDRTPRKPGDEVHVGDTFYLQNLYGSAGYLDTCGDCQVCTSVNKRDVSVSSVRHRAGSGSKTSIWQFYPPAAGRVPAGLIMPYVPLNEGQEIHIKSMYDEDSFLDTCGAAKGSDNRNDVSTAKVPNRDSNSGLWSIIPYDSTDFEALVQAEEDIPPNTVKIEQVQCVIPSSGVAGPAIFGTVSGIVGAALGAGISAALWAPMTVGTGGLVLPLAILGTAGLTAEMSAIGAAVGVGAQAAASKIGQMFPDQAYITVNGEKVWPSSAFTNMNAGDRLDVNWRSPRAGAPTIEIWEHDVILSDDNLFRYQLLPDTELVKCPLLQTLDQLSSSYILYLTATKNRSSRQIVRDNHKAAMERPMPNET
jgi:hypothetical protein